MKLTFKFLATTTFIALFVFLSYPSIYSHKVFESVFGGVRPFSNLAAVSAVPITQPELPRVYVDTSMPTQTGSILYVANNCSGVSSPCSTNLQTTINSAQPGDTIILKAGDVFTGNFILPNKSNSNNKWIILQSSNLVSLPPAGTRVSKNDAVNMPKIVAVGANPAFNVGQGANYYRFIGVEVTDSGISSPYGPILASGSRGGFSYGLIQLGTLGADTQISQVPHHIIFDRSYIHGQVDTHIKYGISMNGSHLAAIDSYFSEFHGIGQDTQAINGFNGPGPVKIVNNYLEAAGENILFGGGDPSIPNLVTSDLEIRNNYFFKPLSWKTYPTPGAHWLVKNIFETKNEQRLLFEGNILENSWTDGQVGFGFVFKSSNQGGQCPWCVSQDLTVRYNIVRNTDNGADFHGLDDYSNGGGIGMRRVAFTNNLLENAGDALFQISPGAAAQRDLEISHNTAWDAVPASGYPKALLMTGPTFTVTNFIFSNNILVPGPNGNSVTGSGTIFGNPSLIAFASSIDSRNNGFVGIIDSPVNKVVGSLYSNLSNAGFTNYPAGDYSILASSPFHNAATDGKDIGADIATINQKTSGAISGNWSGNQSLPPPPPPPPPTPTLTLTSSASSITLGQSVTLTWSTTNATSCTASGGWSGSAALSGSQSVTPTQTTTYTLICGSASQAVTITVSVPPSTPPVTTPPPPVTITPPTTPAPTTPNLGNGMNDTFPPSIPDRLTAFTSHSGELTVRWDSSFDRGGIGGYKVYRDSAQVADVPKEEYIDKGLTPNQSYTYAVSAYDRSGNSSSQSISRTFKVDPSITTTPVVTPTQTTTPTYTFGKNLFYGQENADVLALQQKLKSLGYFSASVTPNGYFGRQTLTAVIKFQRAQGISTTGFVGPMTRGRLGAM